MVEHCIVVVIKLNSRYKDILDIATIWVGTERVVISRPPCITTFIFHIGLSLYIYIYKYEMNLYQIHMEPKELLRSEKG